jgi:hypothetical protein
MQPEGSLVREKLNNLPWVLEVVEIHPHGCVGGMKDEAGRHTF